MIKKYSIIAALAIMILLIPALPAGADYDCPFGLENDPSPGSCGRYIDLNKDGICDHSQEETSQQEAAAAKSELALNSAEAASHSNTASESASTKAVASRYAFVPVLFFLSILYALSYMAAKYGYYSIVVHRRIWNVALLGFFLVSALSGLFLVLRINYRINFSWPFNLLYWHVETGIAMALVSIFHIIWHIPYFKCILRGTNSKKAEVCEDK